MRPRLLLVYALVFVAVASLVCEHPCAQASWKSKRASAKADLKKGTVAGALLASALIVLGIVALAFGWRAFVFISVFVSFVFGFAVSFFVLTKYTVWEEWVCAVIAAVVGLIVVGIVRCAVRIGLFFVGAALGVVIGAILVTFPEVAREVGHDIPTGAAVAVILAFVVGFGVLAVLLEKFTVVVASSFGGAFSILLGIDYFATSGGSWDSTAVLHTFGELGRGYFSSSVGRLLGILGVRVTWQEAKPPSDPTVLFIFYLMLAFLVVLTLLGIALQYYIVDKFLDSKPPSRVTKPRNTEGPPPGFSINQYTWE